MIEHALVYVRFVSLASCCRSCKVNRFGKDARCNQAHCSAVDGPLELVRLPRLISVAFIDRSMCSIYSRTARVPLRVYAVCSRGRTAVVWQSLLWLEDRIPLCADRTHSQKTDFFWVRSWAFMLFGYPVSRHVCACVQNNKVAA